MLRCSALKRTVTDSWDREASRPSACHEKTKIGTESLATVIWNKGTNPSPYVSGQLGIEEWELRKAIHKIKGEANLGGADDVTIYSDGTVTDANGEEIGNILDEI